jgi:hypothetical protein
MKRLAVVSAGFLTAVALAATIANFSRGTSASPPSIAAGPLTVDEPKDGAEMNTSHVTIRGSASPTAEIRLSVSGKDPKTYADATGHWEYGTKLDEGENDFDFYLDDDNDVRAKVKLNWRPPLKVDAPSDGATLATNIANIKGTAPPGAEIHLDVSGPDPKIFAGQDGH